MTRKHNLRVVEINGNKMEMNLSLISPQYNCAVCNYTTINRCDYKKHENSIKHKRKCNINEKCNYICCNCNKEFANSSGLWKHNKKCFHIAQNKNIENYTHHDNNVAITNDIVFEILKNNKELQNIFIEQNKELQNTLIEQNKEHQKQIIEIAQKQNITTTNSNNTTNNNQFNLNFFLNETCKDALNITDFINSLQLTVKDFETTGRLGYVEGISRIILNGIKDMDVSKRPVHCTDLKRETVYIKHENEWEKENTDKKKLKWAINSVAQKNLKQLSNWQLENPECVNIDTRENEDLIKYSLAALGGQYKDEEDKFMDKIMKNVLKEVVIEKKF